MTIQLDSLSIAVTKPPVNESNPGPPAIAALARARSLRIIPNTSSNAFLVGSRNWSPKSANSLRITPKYALSCPMSVLFTASNCPATPPFSASFPENKSSLNWSFVLIFASFSAFCISGPSFLASAITSPIPFFWLERAATTAATCSTAFAGSCPAEPKSIKARIVLLLAFICAIFMVLDITPNALFNESTPSPASETSD